jgi:hypothetical protein
MMSDSHGGPREAAPDAPEMMPRPPRTWLRHFGPLLLLLACAAALIFTDLGGPWLWEDEGDTAIFARTIVQQGLPRAWDGRNFNDSDDGRRVAPELLGQPLLMVGTPWLPYYATAASFALFGDSAWAARLPFALAGVASVAMLYVLVLCFTGCVRSAFAAALLLLASTQFLLYARESRSYAFNMLLTLLLLWGFLRLDRRRDPWLAVAAVLLFHVQIVPAVVGIGACAAVALVCGGERRRLGPLLARAPWVAAFTLPWMLLTFSALRENASPIDAASVLPMRIGQFGSEMLVAIPVVGWAVGLPLVWRRLRRGDRTLLGLCAAWIALCAVFVPLLLSEDVIKVVGVRYVCGILPIAAAVTGIGIARASEGRTPVYAALLVLFAATHLAGNALPWLAIGESRRVWGSVSVNLPRELPGKLWNTQWLAFVRGLGVPDPGTLPPLADLLRANAGPDDVVLTNFGWDNLYFYTRLPQALRIAPDASAVRRKARALGLPSYVSSINGIDWLVWRGNGDALFGHTLEEVGRELESRGAWLERIATLRETQWENRPELAWHRFPRDGYPFAPRRIGAQGAHYPDAQVFRVHWPPRASPAPGPVAP